jgi:uncharacterized SAM-binding protein YcdF (DUF218 family)
MIAGAALVRFLISSAGMATVMLILGIWIAWRPQSPRPRRLLLAAAAFYVLASWHPLSHRITDAFVGRFQPLTRADIPAGRTAIVLLGSGSYTVTDWSGQRQSLIDVTGAERTLEAARVFKMLDDAWIISSGGEIDPEDPDDAAGTTMRQTLIGFGIPADRILFEDRSKTTRDEAVIVSQMLKPLAPSGIVLVTSGFHMKRSLAVFRSVGVNAIPAIAREVPHTDSWMSTYLPSRWALEETHFAIHELLGLAYYRIRGWQG